MVCTGSPVVMGSWGGWEKSREIDLWVFLQVTERNSHLQQQWEQMLDPDMCCLFLWCLGDGRRGLGIVKLPSLPCSTSSGNETMTLSSWHPNLHQVTKEKVPLPLDS